MSVAETAKDGQLNVHLCRTVFIRCESKDKSTHLERHGIMSSV